MSTTAVAVSSGLYAVSGEPVPLEGVTVEATIRDFAATTVVRQRYRNSEAQPIEAVYKFPLDEGAAACTCRRRSSTAAACSSTAGSRSSRRRRPSS